MKHTHMFTAAVLGLALPFGTASAQDPLAELFEVATPVVEEGVVAVGEVAIEEPLHSAADDMYLADVTDVVVTEISDSSLTVSWSAVDDADNYTVYYGTTPIVETEDYLYEADVLAGNVTNYTLMNLAAETTYYIAVTAENLDTLAGSEFYSEEASASTTASAPVVDEASAVEEVVVDEAPAEEVVAEDDMMVETMTDEMPTDDMAYAEDTMTDSEMLTADMYEAAADLPQTGPLTGLALAGAAGGAFILRRLRRS